MLQAFHRGYASGRKNRSIYDDKKELKLLLEVADLIDELKMIRNLLETQRKILQKTMSALRKFHPSDSPDEQPTSNVYVTNCTTSDNGVLSINVRNRPNRDDGIETTRMLAKGILAPASQDVVAADENVSLVLAEIEAINTDAGNTHRMVSLS